MLRIIIISYNSLELTKNCINSIISTYPSAKITVVDNASTDGSVESISESFPIVEIIRNDKNYGYSKAINIGAAKATEKYLILSNADVIYHPNSINEIITCLDANASIGLVAPMQFFPNGRPQMSSGFVPGLLLSLINFALIAPLINRLPFIRTITADYLDGAVLAVRNSTFQKLSGFDESFFFYSEDADFSIRIKQLGLKLKVLSNSAVTHYRGASTNIGKINIDALRLFVEAKVKLSRKYNSPMITKFYVLSERFNCSSMSLIFSLINKLKRTSRTSYKAEYYSLLASQWNNISL